MMPPLKFLHIAAVAPHPEIFAPVFIDALQQYGTLTLIEQGAELSEERRAELIRGCDVLLSGWSSTMIPAAIATEPGRLRYICHVTGELTYAVPLAVIDAGIPVTNWGDAPAQSVAEGAMTLLLAALKDLHRQVMVVRLGDWTLDSAWSGGTLEGADVGIYGCGVIGRRFIEMLRPFRPVIRVFDPYTADLPDGCIRVDSLYELFATAQVIAIHAGLTEETRGSVTAALLALLPRHAVLVNTARGGIIDQDALFAELSSGRLRAGLDVLSPDNLPPDHLARQWENCLFTCHQVGRGWPTEGRPPAHLLPMHQICLDNLNRFVRGEPLRFNMDRERYLRST